MKVRFDVTGTEEVHRALVDGGPLARERAKKTLGLMGSEIASLARPLAPVDPKDGGDLAGSIRVGRPYDAESGVISVAVIAGGNAVKEAGHTYNIYAALQELDIGVGAPFRHTTGQAHYLLRPAEMVAPGIPDRILEAIRPEDLGGE